jgi:hypothetical protein
MRSAVCNLLGVRTAPTFDEQLPDGLFKGKVAWSEPSATARLRAPAHFVPIASPCAPPGDDATTTGAVPHFGSVGNGSTSSGRGVVHLEIENPDPTAGYGSVIHER